MLTQRQLELLKAKLKDSSKETRDLIGPLLGVDVAHDVLLSFVQDSSRTFEDWVWEPSNRAVLMKLRNHVQSVDVQNLSSLYNKALHDDDELCVDDGTLLSQIRELREKAKTQFQMEHWYAAFNLYKQSIDLLEHRVEEKNESEEMCDLYLSSCTNVGIIGLKQKQPTVTRQFVDRVLNFPRETKYHTKALYCKSKSYLLEHRYEEARGVIAHSTADSKELNALWTTIQRVETHMSQREPAQPLTNMTRRDEASTQKGFRMMPLPRRGLPDSAVCAAFNNWWQNSRSDLR